MNRGLTLLAGLSIATLSIGITYSSHSDKTVAILSATLLMACLIYSRLGLRLPLSSGALLYLAVFGLFHLGLVVLWAVGIYQPQGLRWFLPGTLSPAIALITLSIFCFELGLMGAAWSGLSRAWDSSPESKPSPALFYCGLLLFGLGAAIFLSTLSRLGPHTTYQEISALGAQSDPRYVVRGLTPSAMGLVIAAAGVDNRRRWIVLGVLGGWILGVAWIGYRGPALTVAVVAYALFAKKGVRIPKSLTVTAVCLALISIPVLRLTRSVPNGERSLSSAWREAHVTDGIVEMGSSIRPLLATIALMRDRQFFDGRTYLTALKTALPSTSWESRPPRNQPPEDWPPSLWATAWADPPTFVGYGSIGFSAVAEPYMNFGYAGVILYFFGLAFLLVRLEESARRGPYGLAAWGVFLVALLPTTRNDFTDFVRPVTWGLACLFLIWLLWERILPNLWARWCDAPAAQIVSANGRALARRRRS